MAILQWEVCIIRKNKEWIKKRWYKKSRELFCEREFMVGVNEYKTSWKATYGVFKDKKSVI